MRNYLQNVQLHNITVLVYVILLVSGASESFVLSVQSLTCWTASSAGSQLRDLLSCRWRYETTHLNGELTVEELFEPHLFQWKYAGPHFANWTPVLYNQLGDECEWKGEQESLAVYVLQSGCSPARPCNRLLQLSKISLQSISLFQYLFLDALWMLQIWAVPNTSMSEEVYFQCLAKINGRLN